LCSIRHLQIRSQQNQFKRIAATSLKQIRMHMTFVLLINIDVHSNMTQCVELEFNESNLTADMWFCAMMNDIRCRQGGMRQGLCSHEYMARYTSELRSWSINWVVLMRCEDHFAVPILRNIYSWYLSFTMGLAHWSLFWISPDSQIICWGTDDL
jgi:hypothetical protein